MPAMQKQILKLLPKQPSELTLAHIITASRVVSDTSFVDRDRAAMKELGFKVTDILLEDLSPETVFSVLNNFDIIYVQGGDSSYLLDQARACSFEQAMRKILEDENKWYIGVSAGTYIACPTIEMHNWKSEKSPYSVEDMTAMNLVPFLAVVHYNREKYREKLAEYLPTATRPVRILTDDQALLIRGEEVTLVGEGPEILVTSIKTQNNS